MRSLALGALLLPSLVLPLRAVDSTWPVFRGNLYHTGNNDEVVPTNTQVWWTAAFGSTIFHAVPAGGAVFVLCQEGRLACLDEETGAMRWDGRFPSPAFRQPVVGADAIASADFQWLFVMDRSNGAVRWARKDAQTGLYLAPGLSSDAVAYGSRSNLFLRRLVDGHDVFPPIPFQGLTGHAVLDGPRLLVSARGKRPGDADRLVAIDVSNGRTAFTSALPYAIKLFPPVSARGRIWMPSGSNLHVFDAANGNETGDVFLGEYAVDVPCFSDDSVFLPLRDGRIAVVDSKTAAFKRHFSSGFPSAPKLLVVRGTLFAVSTEKRVYGGKESLVSRLRGFDLESGKECFDWESPTPGTAAYPVASRGRILQPVGDTLYSIGGDGKARFGDDRDHDYRARAVVARSSSDSTSASPSGEARPAPEPPPAKPVAPPPPPIALTDVHLHAFDRVTSNRLPVDVEAVTRLPDGREHRSFTRLDGDRTAVPVPRDGDTELLVSADRHFDRRVALSEKDKARDELLPLDLDPLVAGTPSVVDDIRFEIGKAGLRPESVNILLKIRDTLLKNPRLVFEIRGHTDDTGDESFNRTLSLARAETVRDFLVKNGIFQRRLTATGLGSKEPKASNATEEGRAANRRTEFRPLANDAP